MFFILLLSAATTAAEPEIVNIQLYTGSDQTSLPVLDINSSGTYLTIEFDVVSSTMPMLSLVFRLCDRNWNVYDNPFLELPLAGKSTGLDLDYLPSSVSEADYHYKGTFPGNERDLSFPYEGKWKCFITDAIDTSRVYAAVGFYVVNSLFPVSVNVEREVRSDKSYFPSDLARTLNITTSFTKPFDLPQQNVMGVEYVENHKINQAVFVDRNNSTARSFFSWNGSDRFSFELREVMPGNEYRQTDIRSINRYTGKSGRAQFDGVETSRFYRLGKPDNNGGMKQLNYELVDAEYLNITFELTLPSDLSGDVFLAGAFNNWQLLEDYLLKKNGSRYSLTIPLKRGIYDYQYILEQDGGYDWYILEGNFFETVNSYYAFVFYNDPQNGGWDRIVAYTAFTNQ